MNNGDMLEKPKVGEMINARVTYIRDDGRINVSTRPVKEKALEMDASMLYEVLVNRGGKMPYCDTTSPEVIKERFGISKAAFKRALGHLLKQNKIEQKDGWTFLKGESK